MKNLKNLLAMAGCMAALLLSTAKTQAQGRGNWDPAQFRQMRIDGLKEQLSVTNEDEWKVIEPAIAKVMDAQMEVMASLRGVGGMGGGNRRRNNNGETNNSENANRRQRGGGMFGPPPQEVEDLSKAIEDKAPADEIKAKLAKVREVVADREAKLAAAQDELKKLLTSRQEAIAVVNGVLK